uniref:Sodium/potassium-transporting ATPase subunit beta-1-interacting protein n=1 Tax=Panagrellus redivivus TaxID=6233 RepID=A0A7E4UTL3_PANRE
MTMPTSPTQIGLFVTLAIWLLLSGARQVFDLIGKLWIPVVFNLLQILSCINGIFAASQQRLPLLIALSLSSLVSIAYNVLIILWYGGILGDRDSPVLSAGLPYSHSFFLRYTPLCTSEYNLTAARWVQSPRCMVPYYNIEGIQALLHVIIAFVTLVLSLVLLCERRRRPRRDDCEKLRNGSHSPSSSGSSSGRQMPSLFGDAERLGTKALPPPPDSINDVSSGYMNSSYDGVEKPGKLRKSVKSSKSKKAESVRPKSELQILENESVYSSVTTQSLSAGSANSGPNSRASSFKKKSRDANKKRSLHRSASPVRRVSDDGFSEEDEVARQYSKMRSKSSNCLRLSLNPNRRTQSVAEQRLSQAAFEQMRKESSRATLRQESPPTTSNGTDNGDYLEYIKSESKASKPSPRPKTSARISFDPKSSHDFIRVYEHIDHNHVGDDDDDRDSVKSESDAYREVMDCGVKLRAKRTVSQDSVPSIQAPVLTNSNQNLDSGHDSSPSVSPDWSQAGISCVTQRPTASPPLPPLTEPPRRRSIIGYDPTLVSPPIVTTASSSGHISAFSPASTSTSFSVEPGMPLLTIEPGMPLLDALPPPPIQLTTRFLTEPQKHPPPPPSHASSVPTRMYNYQSTEFGMVSPGVKLAPIEAPSPFPPPPPAAYIRRGSSSGTSSGTTQFDSRPTSNSDSTSVVISSSGLLV